VQIASQSKGLHALWGEKVMADNSSGGLDHPVRERRKHRRYFVDLPLDCRVVENKTKGPIQAGIAENAGSGGLSIYLSDMVPSGHQLLLELYYKDEYEFTSLKLLTEVVWIDEEKEPQGYKHGLKLLKLESGGNQKLQSLLKHCPLLL
jgi:hypothetical protein